MLFLVASALVASPEAGAASPAPAQTATAAPAVKPKKICRVEEAVTGSITPKRVCVTAPQAVPPSVQQPAQDAATDKPQQAPSSASGGGH